MPSFSKISFLAWLSAAYIKLLKLTMSYQEINLKVPLAFWSENKPIIIAFWHGRLIPMPLTYHGQSNYVFISQHQDGELISQAMKKFNFSSIRGSTTRGGTKALRESIRTIRAGSDVTITPDGPRGPRLKVQPGIILLAYLTKSPILPVSFGASLKYWISAGWDKLLFPLLFSKAAFIWGNPMWVKDLSNEDKILYYCHSLERRLLALDRKADKLFGKK